MQRNSYGRLCFLAASSNIAATPLFQTFKPIFVYIYFNLTMMEIAKSSQRSGLGCPTCCASRGHPDPLQEPLAAINVWLSPAPPSLLHQTGENNSALTNKSFFPFQTFISDSLGLQVCLGESNSTSVF